MILKVNNTNDNSANVAVAVVFSVNLFTGFPSGE